jgi:flagellar basal-body rod modification protein FlgD
MTTGITPSTGVNVTPSSSTSAAGSSGTLDFTSNFNTFLTLLTTQLKNQDPLSPMDTNQFTQQLVEFSGVEQQINTNTNLKQLIALQTDNEAVTAAPLVGDTIEYNSPTAGLSNGEAVFSYTLPSNAGATSLSVVDASGNVVYSTSGQTTAGSYSFTWNGVTSAGLQEADGGQYSLQVAAADANNTPITATVAAYGVVNGVSIANNATTLDVGGTAVPMSELLAINPTIPPSTASTSTGSN